MNVQQTPAGWYPDQSGRLRYWDGMAWTEHVQDRPQAAPAGGEAKKPSMIRNAASRLTSDEHDVPEGTIWSALGKGMGGITTGRYRLDSEYLYFMKGTLRTDAQQIFVAEVRDVDVKQSMTQKARGVYTVTVHITGHVPVFLEDIPDGSTAQRVIMETAREARLVREHRSIQIDGLRHHATNTVRQEIAYGSMPPGFVQPAPGLPATGFPASAGLPAAAAVPALGHSTAPGQDVVDAVVVDAVVVDPIAQLKELGALRDAGILTEEEFSAKKAEILSRM